jgi:hypothetical protein
MSCNSLMPQGSRVAGSSVARWTLSRKRVSASRSTLHTSLDKLRHDSIMNVTSFPPEYLAEDVSAPLLGSSIAFLILETLFIALLHTSRYLAKGERTDISMEILLTLTYVVCVGKIVIAFRKFVSLMIDSFVTSLRSFWQRTKHWAPQSASGSFISNSPSSATRLHQQLAFISNSPSSATRLHLNVNHHTNFSSLVLIRIGGIGHHLAALPPSSITNALKLTTALQIVCPLTTSLSKLGILCLFYRVFAQASTPYRLIIRITFLLVLSIMATQVLIPFVNCHPFSKTWNPDPRYPGSCFLSGMALWRYLGIPNVFTTVIMVGIPVPALYRLHISRVMKVGYTMVFIVCIIGIVAAVMRFRSFLAVNDFSDITYENVKPLCWTIAESGICFVAGCLLGLKPLVQRLGKGTRLERYFDRNGKSCSSWGFGRRRTRDERVDAVRDDHANRSNEGVEQMRLGRIDSLQAHPVR